MERGPVVLHRHPAQVLGVQRMDLVLQGVQLARPVGLQLLVQELLRPRPIPHPEKLVVVADVAQLLPVHLASQPFPTIDANLHLEGKPGLQADVQPAKGRM